MAEGYSGTPLIQKLGIKPGAAVRLVNPPDWIEQLILTQNPASLTSHGAFDVAIAFCTQHPELSAAISTLRPNLKASGGIWIAWPKKASGLPTTCSDTVVRTEGLASGLVDNKVCAIDATWSALRFVVRTKDR